LQKEAELWFSWFVAQANLGPERAACVTMANASGAAAGGKGAAAAAPPRLPEGVVAMTIDLANASAAEHSRKFFEGFVSRVSAAMRR
jgi:hypothetical protein